MRPRKSSLPQNHEAYFGAPGISGSSLIVGKEEELGSHVDDIVTDVRLVRKSGDMLLCVLLHKVR